MQKYDIFLIYKHSFILVAAVGNFPNDDFDFFTKACGGNNRNAKKELTKKNFSTSAKFRTFAN